METNKFLQTHKFSRRLTESQNETKVDEAANVFHRSKLRKFDVQKI